MPTELRKLVLKKLEEYGAAFEGSVLHVGCADDPYNYRRVFPHASRYHTLDKRGLFKPDIIANVQNMPEIPSKSEDCIIATFMLYQVPDVDAALDEFKRVLNQHGVLFVTFTHRMGAYRIHTLTHEDALKFMTAFTLKEVYQRDVGTLVIGVNDGNLV